MEEVQSMDESAEQRQVNVLSALMDISAQHRRILSRIMQTEANQDTANFMIDTGELFTRALAGNIYDVGNALEANAEAVQKFMNLYSYAWSKSMGMEAQPAAVPGRDDNRFRSAHWNENLWFDTLKQTYLIGSEYLEGLFQATGHMTEKEARKTEFFFNQVIDSLSPTNFAMLNPEVLQKAIETKGQSIVDGVKNLADDLETGSGVKMVDRTAFKLGVDIASTPGKVVARNDLAELIQYTPTTDETREVPILIIPPWINKYYILDLRPKNSYIRWLVEQGFTVFVISWLNPDESFQKTKFDAYLDQGPLSALKEIERITKSKKVNAIGYCLGGTLLSILLAYLAAKKDNRVASATFFTSMIDFSEPGDLGVFVDERSVAQLEKMMAETGYLDGKSMASTFSMMRSNDLIWHFVVNNYLLGNQPGSFDLLYWNSDSTRMPAEMHSWYLRKMYLGNKLREPNGITILDTPVDLSVVKTPCYFLSTRLDHISPWKSTYMGAKLFKGSVKFVLGESGHIAGVINPPAKNKYGYSVSQGRLPATPEKWLEKAKYHEGSWWPHWENWISAYAGKKIQAIEPGGGSGEVICDAPGTYVRL